MKKIISIIIRFVDAIYRYLIAEDNRRIKYSSLSKYEDGVCIILDKGMGDFILYSYYLKILSEYYLTKSKVCIIADEYNVEFYKQFSYREEIDVIVLKANDVRTIEGKPLVDYRGAFKTAILPQYFVSPRSAELLRALSPHEIYSVGKKLFTRKYNILDYLVIKKIRTYDISPDFYCKMHQEFLLKHLEQKVEIKTLTPNRQERIVLEDYFLINVSASSNKHLPEFNQFVLIADGIRKKTGLLPVVVGDLSSIELASLDKLGFCSKYINTRDMRIIISLCQFAKYVITTDTGIYHLALSIDSDSQVFVLTWGKKEELFTPYPCEMKKQFNRVFYLKKYQDCKQCPDKGFKCLNDQYNNKAVYCIRNMDVKQVVEMVNHFAIASKR